MEFTQTWEPSVKRPIVIAAMQDMGDVGSIVVDFVNWSLDTRPFRSAKDPFPAYVVDRGGYVDFPDESWDYRFAEDLIVFGGGGKGQPRSSGELNALCKDVIEISKKYSAKLIYTLGGFYTNRMLEENPKTYISTTSPELTSKMEKLGIKATPRESIITGFNGLILGFAKKHGIQGIGIYGELNESELPQYRTAISIIRTLEKLTYLKLEDTSQLEEMIRDTEQGFRN